jgi:hypothetical protein
MKERERERKRKKGEVEFVRGSEIPKGRGFVYSGGIKA